MRAFVNDVILVECWWCFTIRSPGDLIHKAAAKVAKVTDSSAVVANEPSSHAATNILPEPVEDCAASGAGPVDELTAPPPTDGTSNEKSGWCVPAVFCPCRECIVYVFTSDLTLVYQVARRSSQ